MNGPGPTKSKSYSDSAEYARGVKRAMFDQQRRRYGTNKDGEFRFTGSLNRLGVPENSKVPKIFADSTFNNPGNWSFASAKSDTKACSAAAPTVADIKPLALCILIGPIRTEFDLIKTNPVLIFPYFPESSRI